MSADRPDGFDDLVAALRREDPRFAGRFEAGRPVPPRQYRRHRLMWCLIAATLTGVAMTIGQTRLGMTAWLVIVGVPCGCIGLLIEHGSTWRDRPGL
jgi:hypothetical protein